MCIRDRYFTHEFGVERRRWLVEKHQFWFHGERSRDGDSLLLSARELTRIVLFFPFEANSSEKFTRLDPGLLTVEALHLHLTNGHILENREVLEKIETLKDHSNMRSLFTYSLVAQLVELPVSGLVPNQFAVNS